MLRISVRHPKYDRMYKRKLYFKIFSEAMINNLLLINFLCGIQAVFLVVRKAAIMQRRLRTACLQQPEVLLQASAWGPGENQRAVQEEPLLRGSWKEQERPVRRRSLFR